MKVLFVSNGSRLNKIDVLIENQSESIRKTGISVSHFLITKTNIKGYYQAIKDLHRFLKVNDFDIIHAHYSFCGLVALLSLTSSPVIISFMGSDLHGGKIATCRDLPMVLLNKLISLVVQIFSKKIIVKSENLLRYIIFKKKSSIIPNGVDLDRFYPVNREIILQEMEIGIFSKIILFLGNLADTNKNYLLMDLAYRKINNYHNIKLVAPYPVNPEDITRYLNACNVLVLCSYKEGSPNVIKEAMACNCPIVSTDVGDVKEIIGNTQGCYITAFNPSDVAQKILMALEFSETKGRTNGRNRILELRLDSVNVANRIVQVYKTVLDTRK